MEYLCSVDLTSLIFYLVFSNNNWSYSNQTCSVSSVIRTWMFDRHGLHLTFTGNNIHFSCRLIHALCSWWRSYIIFLSMQSNWDTVYLSLLDYLLLLAHLFVREIIVICTQAWACNASLNELFVYIIGWCLTLYLKCLSKWKCSYFIIGIWK